MERSLIWFVAPAAAITLVLAAFADDGKSATTPRTAAKAKRRPARSVATLLAPNFPGHAQTPAAKRVLQVLTGVRRKLRKTRYQPWTVVRERDGFYGWDCSGMAGWVLRRSALTARAALGWKRPVAATFYQAIKRAPTTRHRWGWQQLRHIEQVRPGDVFAWLRPAHWPPRNTGHVGFVLAKPRPAPKRRHAYLVRIADATSVPHQDDTRSWPGDGGFGTGTILFYTDGQGRATHYGWHGQRSRGGVKTRVLFGRVHR